MLQTQKQQQQQKQWCHEILQKVFVWKKFLYKMQITCIHLPAPAPLTVISPRRFDQPAYGKKKKFPRNAHHICKVGWRFLFHLSMGSLVFVLLKL